MLIVAIAAAASVLVLYLAHRIGRLLAVALAMMFVAGTAVVLAFVAILRDFRDADGFIDCWPNCTAFQDVVGVTALGAPVVFVVALLAVVVVGSFTAATRE